jgi:ABC-type sugar transport system substrate-binding protein
LRFALFSMQSLERIANLLSCFGHARREIALPVLLQECGIPQSSGYKLVDALVREGLLQRPRRGVLALGPAVGSFFFAPLKALPSPAAALAAPAVPAAPRAEGGGRSMTRMVQWNSNLLDLVSTDRYRKDPPFVIGFSNASTASPWRIALARSLMAAAQRQRDVVSHVLVRDAQDDPLRQIAHLEEMLHKRLDLCILSAAAGRHPELEATVRRLGAEGIPVIGVDRVCGEPEDMVCFVTAPDVLVGRISALWLAEFLGGRGRILMLCGREDASPCRHRLQAAMEIFSLYPEIQIEAIEYTNWEARLGQEAVGRHLAQGTRFAGVWCDSGLQGVGSLRAFAEAGYRRGTVPPHTGGEINLMYKLAFHLKVPLCGVDYPAAMGALSFQTGLDTLFGRQVPRRIEANMEIVISRGHETASVKADLLAEEKVRWDREDDYIHASGWIPSAQLPSARGKPFFI